MLPALATAVSDLARIGLGQLGVYLALAGLIGFVEEVFFRGLILRSLATRGALRAAIVSSVLFGLTHLLNVLFGADPAATLLQVGYATAMGFSFASVTLRTGVIWPLIIIHGLTDSAGFVTAGGTTSTGVTSADVTVSVIYIVGFTIYGAIVLQNAQRPRLRRTCRTVSSSAIGSGVRQRPGQPVELGHDQRVAFAARGQGLTQSWPLPVSTSQTVININAVDGHPQRGEAVTLSGQVLLIGRATGVSDQ